MKANDEQTSTRRCALCCRYTQADDSLPTKHGSVHVREDGAETAVRP